VSKANKYVRVLYSFPLKLGAARVCTTAWQLVNGLVTAGADVTVFPAAISRPLPANVKVRPTLARGKFRIPNRALGRMLYVSLHDWIVSRRLEKLAGQFDVVHTWPLGAMRTLKTAARLGIPTFLERPNAHTKFAYEVVQEECRRLGVTMPAGHEHAFNARYLRHEEAEYALADHLLCPSDFVARTFLENGFPADKLARHQYGFDERLFFAGKQNAESGRGLTMIFVGGCAPRKGLHYALEAWLKSTAHEKGTFLIAGEFIPGYAERLSAQLAHPSVKRLGHRSDVPELMRQSDLFVLPSIEEGSALVTLEARGCGCVLLVSDASGAICKNGENALTQEARDVATLAEQMTRLDKDRALLKRLRTASLSTAQDITWAAAGRKLLSVYQNAVNGTSSEDPKRELAAAELRPA
jgi:glycosyltransferase involved in cell wall biosynthesis